MKQTLCEPSSIHNAVRVMTNLISIFEKCECREDIAICDSLCLHNKRETPMHHLGNVLEKIIQNQIFFMYKFVQKKEKPTSS